MDLLKKYNSTFQAVSRLEEFLEKHDTKEELEHLSDYSYDDFYMMKRNSIIKCFEFSLDSLWKYLKAFLEERHGIYEKAPKGVFRACVQVELLSTEEGETAIEMVDSRNQASHIYKEEISEIIYGRIPSYLSLMKKCLELTKP